METLSVNKHPLIFVPSGKVPTRMTPVRFYAIAISLLCLIFRIIYKLHERHPFAFYIVAFIFLLFFLEDLLTRKFISSISIDPQTAELEAAYFNVLAQQKTLSLNICRASYEYKLNTTKSGAYWRILIYNNYFTSRLELREGKPNGFSKPVLDEINEVILKLRK